VSIIDPGVRSATLVKNTGQASHPTLNLNTRDAAQGFRTGANTLGYKLTSIKLRMSTPTPAQSNNFTVSVCPASGSQPDESSCLGTLSAPSPLGVTGSEADIQFTASGDGLDLSPSTTYFVLVDATGGTGVLTVHLTASDDEDTGAAAGWSIRDNFLLRLRGNTAWDTGNAFASHSVKIDVVGYAKTPPPISYDTDGDRLIEIRSGDQLNAIRWDLDGDGTVATTDNASYKAAFPNPLPRQCDDPGTPMTTEVCAGYELAADISLAGFQSGHGWDPIGEYTATLEGNGHKISGLVIDRQTAGDFGLFEAIGTTGTVRNLGIIAPDILVGSQTTAPRAGALAAHNKGAIDGVFVRGGLVDSQSNSNTAFVWLGGLVAGMTTDGASIKNSYSTATVRGRSPAGSLSTVHNLGGLVGVVRGTATVANSYAAGAVSPVGSTGSMEGGLIGAKSGSGAISNSYYDSTVSGRSDTGKGVAKTTAEMKALGTGTGGFSSAARLVLVAGEYPRLPFDVDNFELSRVLVSNTAQPIDSSLGIFISGSTLATDVGQAFTTGTHEDGYRVTAVQLRLIDSSTTSTDPTFAVSICESSSGAPSSTCEGTLSNRGALIFSDGDGAVNWFGATGVGINLEPSTTYFVVADVSAAGNRSLESAQTSSNGEDTAATGWSIAHAVSNRTFSSTGTWNETSGQATSMGILGYGRRVAAISSEAITSYPKVNTDSDPAPDTYRAGDVIEWTVTWDESVTWTKPATSDDVQLRINMGSLARFASLVTGGATTGTGTELKFRYTVASGDEDTDGLSVWAAIADDRNIVTLVGNATLVTTAGGDVAFRRSPYPGDAPIHTGHKVNSALGADAAAPTISTATVNGRDVVVSFNEWLSGDSRLDGGVAAASAFKVTVEGSEHTPTAVSITGHQLFLTLPAAGVVEFGDVVTLDYAKPATNPLEDHSGNEMNSFSDEMVANNTPAPPWGSVDYDTDDDGLIEIRTGAHLNAVRWDLDGDGTFTHAHYLTEGFTGARAGLGCPSSGCIGYELWTGDESDDQVLNLDVAPWNTGSGWKPIGDSSASYTAVFEGNGHTISGLTINTSTSAEGVGLFGEIGLGGEVRDLILDAVNMMVGGIAGALAGSNQGTVSGVRAISGTISGTNTIGGLVGINEGSTVSVSYASVNVTGTDTAVGGLVGNNNNAHIRASYATGAVNGDRQVGGLVGLHDASGTITASYATGSVTGSSETGGLVGLSRSGATVVDSYYDRQTSGRNDNTGKGVPKTTAELKAQRGYTGIYANWNLDLDGDGKLDYPWRFPAGEYPELALGQPFISELRLLTRPESGSTYRAGEIIEIEAAFSEPMLVSGDPKLSLYSDDGWFAVLATSDPAVDPDFDPANNPRDNSGGIEKLVFRYVVQPGDSARRFFRVGTHDVFGGGLVLGGGAALTSLAGLPVNPLVASVQVRYHVDGGPAPRNAEQQEVPSLYDAEGECRRDIKLRTNWSRAYYHGHPGRLGVGCETPGVEGSYSMFFTFTLDSAAQVRLEADGYYPGQTKLLLRRGRMYSGDPVHEGAGWLLSASTARIDQRLEPGVWTVEVTDTREWPNNSGASFRLFAARGQTPASVPAACKTEIGLTTSRTGRWSSGCASLSRPGSHAHYYTFSAERTELVSNLTATSADGGVFVYVWEDGTLIDQASSSGISHALIPAVLVRPGKTYTVEVASLEGGRTGGYTYAQSSTGHAGDPAPAHCRTDMGVKSSRGAAAWTDDDWDEWFSADWGPNWQSILTAQEIQAEKDFWSEYLPTEVSASAAGTLDQGCLSTTRPGSYARYITFTLPFAWEINIDLFSSQLAGVTIYLREGSRATNGDYIAESHRPEGATGGLRRRLTAMLEAGTYTMEIAAHTPGRGGRFNITMK